MTPPPGAWRDRLVRSFRWHAWSFAAINVGLTVINIMFGRPWWALWPLVATGVVLGVHYMLFKALTADERWVDERTRELAIKSYDRSHIESIRERQQHDEH